MSPSPAGNERRTVAWVVALCAAALVFDGYDLVVYGTIVPTLLGDPTQLGHLSAAEAGRLGSLALIGVLVGALSAGAVADRIGRRRIVLVNLVWFSVGMALTAMTTSITAFGMARFFTGIGIGALVATVGALVAEFAPAGQKNRYNAFVYSGIPAGGVLAALVALALDDVTGWRGLFWVGALPLLVLFPLALVKLPESPAWLAERGRPRVSQEKIGFAALASRRYGPATVVLGAMSFVGLLLTYGLNTWLPEIMGQNGYGKDWSLTFLLILNGGAIVGGLLASTAADRFGARNVVATTFLLATLTLVLLPLGLPIGLLVACVAIAGVGTIGTQVLIYGLVSNYYPTSARGAGVAWCAGFGRLGGILGPVIGGVLVDAGLGGDVAFKIFAGVAVLGAVVTLLVPASSAGEEQVAVTASMGTGGRDARVSAA